MKITNALYGILVMSVAFFGSGCATIVSGTTQKINVTSNPSDAIAVADNNMSANTPTMFTLDRKNDHTIEVSKEGYKTTTVLIKKTFNGATAGNILIGGIIGGGIDMASGSSNKLVPERIDLVLEPGTGNSSVPQFAATKDQEFYEKSILKTHKQKPEKSDTLQESDFVSATGPIEA